MRIFKLYFYGYTWEEYAFQISSLKGIFVIYQGCLDPEGSVDIKDLLYVGYHNGIISLYENGVIDAIKQYVEPGNRLYLSYGETRTDEEGKELASMIIRASNPKYKPEKDLCDFQKATIFSNGNCKFLPEEIIV